MIVEKRTCANITSMGAFVFPTIRSLACNIIVWFMIN
jgi:hypothetical protein